MTERDDEAWRAIVDNYGERADLTDERPDDGDRAGGDLVDRPDPSDGSLEGSSSAGSEIAPGSEARNGDDPAADDPAAENPAAENPAADDSTAPRASTPEEEGFVPPPAPPLPYVAPPRLAAGVGVFGAPLVLLVCVVLGISVPGWLAYLLVASFVGGFAWLVAHMRKRPDDPWDDGARV